MTGRQRVAVLADPKSIVIKGSAEAVRGTLTREHGYRPIYVGGTLGGWLLNRTRNRVDRLPDVLARLEAAGHHVTSVETDWSGELPPPRPAPTTPAQPAKTEPAEPAKTDTGMLW